MARAISPGTPPVEDPNARVPVTKLWGAYVIGWLLVLLVTVGLIANAGFPLTRLVAALACMTALGGLFLWSILRDALEVDDFSPDGPGAAVVRRRLLWLAVMLVVIVILDRVAPGIEAWWLLMHVVVAAGLMLSPRWAAVVIPSLILTSFVWGRFDGTLLVLIAFGVGTVGIRQLTITVAQLRAAQPPNYFVTLCGQVIDGPENPDEAG